MSLPKCHIISARALRRLRRATGYLLASVALWGVVAWWMHYRELNFASTDDFFRLVIAMDWARRPAFFVKDGYWPPLPFWIFGAGYRLVGAWIPLFWHIPCAAALLALATAGLQVGTGVLGKLDRATPPPRPSAPWLVLVLALTVPFAWRLAASGLAESVSLACQSLFVVGLILHLRRPAPAFRLMALAGLIGLQMTRYETWPLAFAAWAILILTGWPAGGWRSRTGWLLAGWAALGAFPASWMILHQIRNGSYLCFTNFFKNPPPEGLQKLKPREPFTVIFQSQGWAILPCLLGGLWLSRRQRAAIPLLLLFLVTWAIYALATANQQFQIVTPERMALMVLWAALPLAALGLGAAWDWGRRHKGLPCLLILLVAAWRIQSWDRAGWGGPVMSQMDFEQLETMSGWARDQHYMIVIEQPEKILTQFSMLRCYAGIEQVADQAWFPPGQIRAGRFIYLSQSPRGAGAERLGRAFGRYVYRLRRMPPGAHAEATK